MARTLAEAREAVRYGRTNARLLESVEPGQRVIRLVRNEYGYYLPELAEVVRITPSGRVTILIGMTGDEKVTVGIDSLFTEPGGWCDGDPYVTTNGHNGTHNDGCIGVGRKVYHRVYPRKHEPTHAEVLRDWQTAPETFTEGWCSHK